MIGYLGLLGHLKERSDIHKYSIVNILRLRILTGNCSDGSSAEGSRHFHARTV